MGASLDTPAVCPLCNELIGNLVTLKCKHRFCQRCIGDLWSVSPFGPYRCPEWRCDAEYKTLPFGATAPARPTSSGEGTSSYHDDVSPQLSRPSLASRLLGKRKASAPADDQLDSKRPFTAPPPAAEPSNEPPETPPGDPLSGPPAPEDTPPSPSMDDDRKSSTNSDASVEETREASVRQNKPRPEPEVQVLDDSSTSSSDVDSFNTASAASIIDHGGSRATGLSRVKPPSPAPSRPSSSGTQHPSPRRLSWPSPFFSAPLTPAAPAPAAGLPLSPRFPLVHQRLPSSPPPLHTSPGAPPAGPSAAAVLCHYCAASARQSAVKTCLVCGASMCAEHLRPHLESPVFRNHALVAPIDDLSAWRCPEHQEMSRIYCRRCAVCVCTVCTVIGAHRDHACVSIREAEMELRGNLKEEIQQLQVSESALIKRLAELKQKKLDFLGALEEARGEVRLQYEAMREALEQEERSALQCVVQEETRSIGGLEGHLGKLQDSLTCVQQGLHTLEGLVDAKGEQRVQEQAFIMEYSKITQMFSDAGPIDVDLGSIEEVDRVRLKCLKSWTEKRLNTLVISLPERDPFRLLYGTVPTLDPDTAHPKLLLSHDDKQVAYGDVQQAYADHGARFSSFPQVLASKALDQGRWYWEVEVTPEDGGQWKVGVSEAQIGRKGQKGGCRLGFNPYSWCVGSERGKVEAMHDRASVPVAAGQPQRIAVFLDFVEGVLSFYSVTPGGALVSLHTYKQRFAEPLYPAFSVCKAQLTICDLFKMSDPE